MLSSLHIFFEDEIISQVQACWILSIYQSSLWLICFFSHRTCIRWDGISWSFQIATNNFMLGIWKRITNFSKTKKQKNWNKSDKINCLLFSFEIYDVNVQDIGTHCLYASLIYRFFVYLSFIHILHQKAIPIYNITICQLLLFFWLSATLSLASHHYFRWYTKPYTFNF